VSFWTNPKTDAPYLCIEPWYSLPAIHGKPAVFEEQPDLVKLEPGKQFREIMEIELT
jgi:galactose mutarotase-like enzyme